MPKGSDGAERTTVNAIPAEQVPRSWLPSLRLIAWLREILGGGGVIDVEEVSVDDSSSDRMP